MSHSAWWKGLPGWLKLVYLLVAIPAWLFMMFLVVTGQSESPTAYAAFAAFAGAALLHIVFDRRGGARDNGGISFDGGGD